MKSQRILGALSVGVIAASLFAQAVPLCCRYLYDWPNGPGDQGPSGACSGNHARVCESGSNSADSTDPMSMAWNRSKSPRWAQCCTWDLSNGAYFMHSSCDIPPVLGATRIGQLSNGTCCWVVNPPGGIVTLSCTDQTFKVIVCENECKTKVE